MNVTPLFLLELCLLPFNHVHVYTIGQHTDQASFFISKLACSTLTLQRADKTHPQPLESNVNSIFIKLSASFPLAIKLPNFGVNGYYQCFIYIICISFIFINHVLEWMSKNRRIGSKAVVALIHDRDATCQYWEPYPHKCVKYCSPISHDTIVPKMTIYKYFTRQTVTQHKTSHCLLLDILSRTLLKRFITDTYNI